MGQPLIVVGDTTDHGGTVIGSTAFTSTGGREVARIGDMVACPRCKGVFPISEGDSSLIIDGWPAAFNGCKVSCGATLISSQMLTSTVPSAGAAPGAGDGDKLETMHFGGIGGNLAAAYVDEAIDENRFQG
jgi:uncharacterized Zn-binding protein involved in type VI secretion